MRFLRVLIGEIAASYTVVGFKLTMFALSNDGFACHMATMTLLLVYFVTRAGNNFLLTVCKDVGNLFDPINLAIKLIL